MASPRPLLPWAIGLAVALGVFQVAMTAIFGAGFSSLLRSLRTFSSTSDPDTVLGPFFRFFALVMLMALLSLMLQVAQGFVVGFLLSRAGQGNRLRGVQGATWAPAWAVGGWFIPYANFVIPFLVCRELWRASQPGAPFDPAWKTRPVPSYINAWWALWVGVTGVLGFVSSAVLQVQIYAGGMQALSWTMAAVAAALYIAAGVLFVRFLKDIVALHETNVGAPHAR